MLKSPRSALLYATSLLLTSIHAHAVSFDCRQAKSTVEQLICGDHQLSKLDDQLGEAYRAARQNLDSATAKRISTEQARWLKDVRNRCVDGACLAQSYKNRIAELTPQSAQESSSPILKALESNAYRPSESHIREDGGRIFISQYDSSGNNYDVIGLSIDDLARKDVVLGRHGAQFVAQSERFIVVQEEARLTSPLVVIDRLTGATLKTLKLQRRISWGRIEGNRLLAIQGGQIGDWQKAPALIFELPTLKILKQVELIGGNDATWWNGLILSLGRDLAAFDADLNPVFEIKLPPRKTGGSVSCTGTGPLRVNGNRAVIVTNCGEFLIYDLASRSLERTIPAYAHFYGVALSDDGLMFTASQADHKGQKGDARVHDLATGEELAALPINATDVFVKGDKLLAVGYQFAQVAPMTVYTFRSSALRDGRWRVATAIEKCKSASKLVSQNGDLYGAIDLCMSSGIEGLAKSERMPDEAIPIVAEYAAWLTRTLDRAGDAIPILKRLLRRAPTEEMRRQLAEAELKVQVVGGRDIGTVAPGAKDSDFARILMTGKELSSGLTRNIRFGAFAEVFHFSGNRVYVGRYGSGVRNADSGTSLGVLDRVTFDELADVPLVPADEVYQDNIASIASDANRIYLRIAYRYEQAGRTNLAVLDKSSLKVVRRIHTAGPDSLVFDGGNLLACGCSFTESQECVVLDPHVWKATDAPGTTCSDSGEKDHVSIVSFAPEKKPASPIVAVTKDYAISQGDSKGSPYAIISKVEGNIVSTVDIGENDWLSWPLSIDGNTVVVGQPTQGAQRLIAVTLPTGILKTVLGVPTSASRLPIPLLTKQTLYVALGRDLILLNTKDYRLRRYIRDFIVAPKEVIPSGYDDEYRIRRLLVDRDRLVAITFSGQYSRIISLANLP